MRKEYIILGVSTLISLVVALGLVRIFEPRLFGVPTDMEVVQLSKTIPPFFENVFRKEDFEAKKFLLNDPILSTRGKPLLAETQSSGPHDILGFRNRAVPIVADVIAIGDSQTYGINVPQAGNWPSLVSSALAAKSARAYNMALGSWGAVQYLAIFSKALIFQPRVVVVAFYTGNDAHDSFKAAYALDAWQDLRLDKTLTIADLPPVKRLSAQDKTWDVTFKDGLTISFHPKRRLISNDTSAKAIQVGHEIIGRVAEELAKRGKQHRVKLIFTIIPTKELAYEKKVVAEGITQSEEYVKLLSFEKKNISALAEKFRVIDGATYVDLVEVLQEGALQDPLLYPPDIDGHPLRGGHKIIAEALLPFIEPEIPGLTDGVYEIDASAEGKWYYLLRNKKLWRFYSKEILERNGWQTRDLKRAEYRDMARFPLSGVTAEVNPKAFGPHA